MGPFILIDLLGLDTVLHVAEHLNESYGDSFYVHKGMKKLVEEGKLGAKSGGEGFYKDGEPQLEGDAEPDAEELADLFTCSRRCVEACLLLEEGVCTVRDIDLGMMAGAGHGPAPRDLPAVLEGRPRGPRHDLERIEKLEEEHGERFAPPRDPEAAGRPGPPRPEVRPGLLRLPAARRGRAARARSSSRRAASRDRLARQPADERDLAAGDRGPRQGLGAGQGRPTRSGRW